MREGGVCSDDTCWGTCVGCVCGGFRGKHCTAWFSSPSVRAQGVLRSPGLHIGHLYSLSRQLERWIPNQVLSMFLISLHSCSNSQPMFPKGFLNRRYRKSIGPWIKWTHSSVEGLFDFFSFFFLDINSVIKGPVRCLSQKRCC